MNKSISHIIFDLDNTLVNEKQSALLAQVQTKKLFTKLYSKYVSNQKINSLFSKESFSIAQKVASREIKTQLPKDAWRQLYFSKLFKDCLFDININELINAYSKYKDRIPTLIPGVKSVINYLHEKYTLSIATNSYTDISALEIYNKFVDIVRAMDIGVKKPDELFFKKTLQRLHLNRDEVYFIGDDQREDIYGGIKAGLKTIWFNRRRESQKSFILKPDYIVYSWKEIITIL